MRPVSRGRQYDQKSQARSATVIRTRTEDELFLAHRPAVVARFGPPHLCAYRNPANLLRFTSTGEANRPLLAGRRRSADLRLARWKRNSSASAWGKFGENIGPCGPNATTLPTNSDQS